MKLPSTIVLCLFASHANVVGGEEVSTTEIVGQITKVEHPHLYSELYRSLFTKVGPGGLVDLQTLPDDSIAIQSAWETVALTVPVEDGDKVYRPDRRKLSWFMGFLTGRVRISPPSWWQDTVLKSKANRRDNIYSGKPKQVPYHRTGIDFVNCPKNAAIETTGKSVVYRVGEDQITIPEELLDRADSGELLCNISGCFTEEHCFIAVHSDVGYPHDVACIDRSSAKLVWKSTACGCWWGGASGLHESWVSVVPTNDNRVFVFGMASMGFYFHGFRSTDGESLVHYSNNY